MPTLQTDHHINLDQLEQAFGNSKSKHLLGGQDQLKAKAGITGWLQNKLMPKDEKLEAQKEAERQLNLAYKASNLGLESDHATYQLIRDTVRGNNNKSVGELITDLKQSIATQRAQATGHDLIQQAGGAQNVADVVAAYEGLVAPLVPPQKEPAKERGAELYEVIQNNPNLSPEQKQAAICQIAEKASEAACLNSPNAGNLARDNTLNTQFLTASVQDQLAHMAVAVAQQTEQALENANLPVHYDAAGQQKAAPQPGDTDMPPYTKEELKQYNDAYAQVANGILNQIVDESQNLNEAAQDLMTAIKKGAMQAAQAKPALRIDSASAKDSAIAADSASVVVMPLEEVGNRMVQAQIILRVVNVEVNDRAAWKQASPDPDIRRTNNAMTKTTALVQAYDNYSTGNGPVQKDGTWSKKQDLVVHNMRQNNPGLIGAYRNFTNDMTKPIALPPPVVPAVGGGAGVGVGVGVGGGGAPVVAPVVQANPAPAPLPGPAPLPMPPPAVLQPAPQVEGGGGPNVQQLKAMFESKSQSTGESLREKPVRKHKAEGPNLVGGEIKTPVKPATPRQSGSGYSSS
jgi:hypothetical protein